MDEQITRDELLHEIRAARAEWEAILEEVGEERMQQPGVTSDWSVKDIVAHVAWSELEIIPVFRDHTMSGSSELWEMEQDARNAAVYDMNRHRPLEEVLAEERQAYSDLLPALEALTEEDLIDPSRFQGMPPEWQPWILIPGNTYKHYREHTEMIRA
jgi:hypothetical protein